MEPPIVTRNSLIPLLLGGAGFSPAAVAHRARGGNPLDCSTSSPTTLGVGEHTIIDAAQSALFRLPAAGLVGPNTSTRRWRRTARRPTHGELR